MGGFETGGLLKRVQSIFLSDQTRQEGWTYFMLEPGLHYLYVSFWTIDEDASDKPVPSWKLDIPSDTMLMYTGTCIL